MELKQIKRGWVQSNCSLLIVPYGIETFERSSESCIESTFNRTLWN